MTKTENLLAVREHLRDSIECHRQKLAKMWEAGTNSGWRFDKINEQYERMQDKYQDVCNQLCPLNQ